VRFWIASAPRRLAMTNERRQLAGVVPAKARPLTTGRNCCARSSSRLAPHNIRLWLWVPDLRSPHALTRGRRACPGRQRSGFVIRLSNSQRACFRSLAALTRPSVAASHPLSRKRAQGMPGAGRPHGPPAKQKAGGSYHRFSQNIRHSLRDGLTTYFVLSPGNRACLPPSSARSSLAT